MAGEFTIKRIPNGYEAEFPIEEYAQVKTTANKYSRILKATVSESHLQNIVIHLTPPLCQPKYVSLKCFTWNISQTVRYKREERIGLFP